MQEGSTAVSPDLQAVLSVLTSQPIVRSKQDCVPALTLLIIM